MDQLIVYIVFFSLIVLVGQVFQNSTIPLSLILVVVGMLISFLPFMPEFNLQSDLVLDVFLPLLIYQISSFSSWRDIRKLLMPIASLSIGHVIFITILVAFCIHALIPQMSWPMAFVLGAVVSPPDDVAIASISQKIRIPERILLILEGEGMFNDAAALIFFRFALAAAITHQFSATQALSTFVIMLIGEIIYGFLLGHIIGTLRLHITDVSLHVIASLVTPFLAYIPVVLLGGTGVMATAITGFIIGNVYSVRFSPDFRLISFALWPVVGFTIQMLIFLMVGLNIHSIFKSITVIPFSTLLLYVLAIASTVIIGRFIWVYGSTALLPKFLLQDRNKEYRAWQGLFLVSWSGMRGGISLAAALAIPPSILFINGIDFRNLIVFLVLSLIFITFILQGLTIPLIMRKFGFDKIGQRERYEEHLTELETRMRMIKAGLKWLKNYRDQNKDNKKLTTELHIHILEYQNLAKKYSERIQDHTDIDLHDEHTETSKSVAYLLEASKAEKTELMRLWREEKISLRTRNKMLSILDHQMQKLVL
jgi:monovalent cation/hydrogen antiporter